MDDQISIFDYKPTLRQEPDVGAHIPEVGAVIPHIMIPSYIGKKVAFNCSTESRRCFRVGILEEYVPYGDYMRAIIFDGKRQRALVTLYPWMDGIHEVLPWESYPGRIEAISRRDKDDG